MRYFTSGLCAVSLIVLVGCSMNSGSSGSSLPSGGGQSAATHTQHLVRTPINLAGWQFTQAMRPNRHLPPDTTQRGGIYASEFRSDVGVFGYSPKPPISRPTNPVCRPSGFRYNVNGIEADEKGNLIVPGSEDAGGENWSVDVYQGAAQPHICGKLLGRIPVTNGQPVDAFSFNAVTGPIAVSVIDDTTNLGEIEMCSLASLACSAPITSPDITGYSAGVAMAKNGNCWLSTAKRVDIGIPAGFRLIFFKGCKEPGQVATGTDSQSFYGGLFRDGGTLDGNRLGSFDAFDSVLTVYKDCKPDCTKLAELKLAGQSFFGGLNGSSKRLAAGDSSNGSIDVYQYDPKNFTNFKLLYSIDGGLDRSRLVM